MDPLLILFGLGVGILVGTTGMGGGSLMTPLLILVFGIKPVVAIGTDLAYAAVTKTVGGWRHFRQGTVDVPLALWLGVGSIPGALGGTLLLDRLQAAYGDSIDNGVIIAVAVALLFTGVAVFWRALFMPTVVERERDTIEPLERRHKLAAIALGLTIGFVLGATSAGSGALIAVGLILIFRLKPLRVVGTDVFHARSCSGSPPWPTWPRATSTCTWPATSSSARSRACGWAPAWPRRCRPTDCAPPSASCCWPARWAC